LRHQKTELRALRTAHQPQQVMANGDNETEFPSALYGLEEADRVAVHDLPKQQVLDPATLACRRRGAPVHHHAVQDHQQHDPDRGRQQAETRRPEEGQEAHLA
jgi:hypothetical protein